MTAAATRSGQRPSIGQCRTPQPTAASTAQKNGQATHPAQVRPQRPGGQQHPGGGGRDTECVAKVNASPDHVMQAAASLGWAIDDGRAVSPSHVVIVVEQEPPEPDMFPLVTLTARR
jgi:hypothetical protein